MKNIILIGPMGSGKSTIGRLLAEKLTAQFVDTDEELESRTGVSVATIFEIEGESGFRCRESKFIEELHRYSGAVIATGGGAVLNPANRALLREAGFVIYLKAELGVLYERLKGGKGRPLLEGDNLEQKLQRILAEREAIYQECAHAIVQTGLLCVDNMVDEIIKLIPPAVHSAT